MVPSSRPERTETDQKVAELLRTAKNSLGLSLTFLSRMDGVTQHLEVVESSIPFFHDGQSQDQTMLLCQAILDGKLPPVIPNVDKLPEAKRLPAARFPRIRSYVSVPVPVSLSDGTLYGAFCAAGFTADNQLSKRDRALMEVLASAATTLIEPGVFERRRAAALRERLDPMFEVGGPDIVLQPTVALDDGRRAGAIDTLSRFPRECNLTPDVVFAEAASRGRGIDLELLAVRQAVSLLDDVSGYLAINFSPGAVIDERASVLLRELPLERLVLELSEHDRVEDYAVLAPLGNRSLRLAIDDVGAGFSSLRHIVVTSPDVIKLYRSIVAGLSDDPVLFTLAEALVSFGHASDVAIVAEGVENREDAAALRALGIDFAQGWYFARPGSPHDMAKVYAVQDLLR